MSKDALIAGVTLYQTDSFCPIVWNNINKYFPNISLAAAWAASERKGPVKAVVTEGGSGEVPFCAVLS